MIKWLKMVRVDFNNLKNSNINSFAMVRENKKTKNLYCWTMVFPRFLAHPTIIKFTLETGRTVNRNYFGRCFKYKYLRTLHVVTTFIFLDRTFIIWTWSRSSNQPNTAGGVFCFTIRNFQLFWFNFSDFNFPFLPLGVFWWSMSFFWLKKLGIRSSKL